MVIQHDSARAGMGTCLLTAHCLPRWGAQPHTGPDFHVQWFKRKQVLGAPPAAVWLFPQRELPTYRGPKANTRKDQTSELRGVLCPKCLPLFEYRDKSLDFPSGYTQESTIL